MVDCEVGSMQPGSRHFIQDCTRRLASAYASTASIRLPESRSSIPACTSFSNWSLFRRSRSPSATASSSSRNRPSEISRWIIGARSAGIRTFITHRTWGKSNSLCEDEANRSVHPCLPPTAGSDSVSILAQDLSSGQASEPMARYSLRPLQDVLRFPTMDRNIPNRSTHEQCPDSLRVRSLVLLPTIDTSRRGQRETK